MCGTCGCGNTEENHSLKDNSTSKIETHHHNSKIIEIEQDILAENNRHANTNRDYFTEKNVLTLNLVSSPGSGKTTLLENTLNSLDKKIITSVIEGDQQTDRDAKRIQNTGSPVLQINTGKGCHLDAHQIGHAIQDLMIKNKSILFIENVGNLICPALFDLGETHRIVILSVTEGDDKPLKYPDMFHKSDLMIINKMDLLPHVDFNCNQCITYARRINPNIKVLQLTATKTGSLTPWLQWLAQQHQALQINNADA